MSAPEPAFRIRRGGRRLTYGGNAWRYWMLTIIGSGAWLVPFWLITDYSLTDWQWWAMWLGVIVSREVYAVRGKP